MTSFVVSDQAALLGLCASLQERSSVELQRKINKFLEDQTGATISFLAPCESFDEDLEDVGEDHETSSSPRRLSKATDCSVTSLYIQVISRNSRRSPIRLQPERFHPESAQSWTSERPIFLHHLSAHQKKFFEDILDASLSSFLAVPIFGICPRRKTRRMKLIACLANNEERGEFDDRDAQVVKECFQVALGILENTLAFEEERRLKKQCQSLLTVARNLFTHLDDVTVLLSQIMSEARQLTEAERCSLFLLDQNELVAKVFDGDVPEKASTVEYGLEVRLPVDQGIAGHVAQTGKMLNIRDAQRHPLFYRNIDQATGFTTRNILCFPIKDDQKVIGVAELCNKTNGVYFTQFDEEIALAFSAYCGISIIHSLMYKKVVDAQHRSKLSNELMMYHMKVADEDVAKLVIEKIPSIPDIHPDFCKFFFTPRLLTGDDTPAIVYAMMQHLGLINRFRIPRKVLARFILMVRRGYRDPPYHNWTHAFTVAHFCFLLITNLRLVENKLISDLEALALFMASLCHDLDHRGTNNSFQLTSNSVLAALYSSEGSVMERHHLAQAMCILNTDGCNLLQNLPDKDYMSCLDLLRDIVLATDLAHHFRIKPDLDRMVSSGYDPWDSGHRRLLLSLLMTACDLSDQAKDWDNSKNTAELVYSEFFSQGDLEKAMGNKPQPSMDRERAYIPTLQIEFIDGIALPVYKDLCQLFPRDASVPYQAVQANRVRWGRAHEALQKRGRNGIAGNVRDIFRDESIEREVAVAVEENNNKEED